MIEGFLFLTFEKNYVMSPQLKKLMDNGIVNEMEVIEFLSTLKKLTSNELLDKRNYKLVLEHFGLKKKKGWIKFGNGSKYKFK